jgi:hypothetical protein
MPTGQNERTFPEACAFRRTTALLDLLRDWLRTSHAPTIGDIGSFGGKA